MDRMESELLSNARLMAAAPAMAEELEADAEELRALRVLLGFFLARSLFDSHDFKAVQSRIAGIDCRLEAIGLTLARANGEQP